MGTHKMLYVYFNAPIPVIILHRRQKLLNIGRPKPGNTGVNACQGYQYLTKSNEYIYSKFKLEGCVSLEVPRGTLAGNRLMSNDLLDYHHYLQCSRFSMFCGNIVMLYLVI